MNENKIEQINHVKEIMANYLNKQTRLNPTRPSNIITHLPAHNFSTIFSNPEEPVPLFSQRKTIPKNNEVLRQRSQMIVHPSKISKDVPGWFKGETYKYYSRNNFNELHRQHINNTIDYPRDLLGVVHLPRSNRSEVSTPHSQRSNEEGSFYFGGGRRQEYMRRVSLRKPTREISGKIGSVETRNFQLPRIPVKIGRDEYIDTHRAF